jgi:hypothetical protein
MAAQSGSLLLIGLKSKKTYNVDTYFPDAAGTFLTFSLVSAASSTSPNFLVLPEDVQIYDLSLTTSPTATNVTLYADNAPVVGGVIRYANQLTSLPNRQRFNICLPKGAQFQGIQAA